MTYIPDGGYLPSYPKAEIRECGYMGIDGLWMVYVEWCHPTKGPGELIWSRHFSKDMATATASDWNWNQGWRPRQGRSYNPYFAIPELPWWKRWFRL